LKIYFFIILNQKTLKFSGIKSPFRALFSRFFLFKLRKKPEVKKNEEEIIKKYRKIQDIDLRDML